MNDQTVQTPTGTNQDDMAQDHATWDSATQDSANQDNADQYNVSQGGVSQNGTDQNNSNSSSQDGITQELEDQNIFFLLGVGDGSEEDRERFLDELQKVIWDDFLDRDLQLLVTTDEYNELKPLLDGSGFGEGMNMDAGLDLSKQEELMGKLEELIPDLEDIMLEKALELKADLLRERVASMREFYSGNEGALKAIDEAESNIQLERWYDAGQALNGIK